MKLHGCRLLSWQRSIWQQVVFIESQKIRDIRACWNNMFCTFNCLWNVGITTLRASNVICLNINWSSFGPILMGRFLGNAWTNFNFESWLHSLPFSFFGPKATPWHVVFFQNKRVNCFKNCGTSHFGNWIMLDSYSKLLPKKWGSDLYYPDIYYSKMRGHLWYPWIHAWGMPICHGVIRRLKRLMERTWWFPWPRSLRTGSFMRTPRGRV